MSFGIVATTAIGAGASIYGAKKAAGSQNKASKQASKTELKMFNIARDDQKPWTEGGRKALNELGFLLGLDANGFNTGIGANATDAERAAYSAQIAKLKSDPRFGSLNRQFTLDDFEKDPGYDFRQAEGMKGITNSATARGGVLSGEAAKAIARFNQDYASGEYTNAFNRFNTNQATKYNRLASLAGVGQQSAGQVGNQAIQTGNSIAQNQIGAGNARASGYIAGANALTGALGQGMNWYQQNKLFGGGQTSGYYPYGGSNLDIGNMS